jgi:hypothetical protein
MLRTGRPWTALLLELALLPAATATSGERAAQPASEEWLETRVALRSAAGLVAAGQYRAADGYLDYYAERVGKPYSGMIAAARKSLAELQAKSPRLDAYQLKGLQIGLCLDLGDHRHALRLCRQVRRMRPRDPAGHSRYMGWCLLEAGQVREARLERSRHPELLSEKELKLAARLHSGQDHAAVVLEYVREHYLRKRGDRLAALERLTVALGRPHRGQARLDVYAAIFDQFREINDERGLVRWEDRLLADFPDDAMARSAVHMARGKRAAAGGDYALAVSEMAEVTSAELRRGADARLVGAFVDRRHRAALLASDYCEQARDWQRAYDYAVSARDEYPPRRRSGGGAQLARDRLNERIRWLAARLKKAGKPVAKR